MSARDAILAQIRRSLGALDTDLTRRAAVADRLQRAPNGVIPARGQLPMDERIKLFLAKAQAAQATTATVASPAEVPARVAAYLRHHTLPPALRMGEDPRLTGLDWTSQPQLTLAHGPSTGDDPVCISHADAAVAETGTLVLFSGPDNPTTLNFLPDVHIILVEAADVVGDLEAVWASMRAHLGVGVLPRTVNLVTGPSRSADIEQTLLLGAHGPRSLHVMMIGSGCR